jgi:hypothetical protein
MLAPLRKRRPKTQGQNEHRKENRAEMRTHQKKKKEKREKKEQGLQDKNWIKLIRSKFSCKNYKRAIHVKA